MDKEQKKYGDGSVWQRKDGRWEGSFSAGIDEETGKRIRKNVLAKTEVECIQKLKKAMKAYRKEHKIEEKKKNHRV